MRAICFTGIGNVAVLDVAEAVVEQPTDCVVQVDVAGLCGSDLHPFTGREVGLDPGTVMGHEFVGKIVDVGASVQHFRVGDRVFSPFSTNCGTCFFCKSQLPSRCPAGQLFGWRSGGRGLQGAQCQYVRVPLADTTLLKMPEEISSLLALLLGDNLSTGYYCTELAGLRPDGIYAIIGCGNVGLMALASAIIKGCENVIAIDPVPERRALATQMGATASIAPGEPAINLIHSLSQDRGADGVMELVGNPAAQKLAYQLVRPGGVIATVGCHCDPNFAFSPVEAYDKNLTYRTGRCPARFYMEQLAAQPAIRELDATRLVTHVFSLNDGPLAYELFSQRRDGIIKGVFDLS